ncbi:Na+/H+ antiporter NhaC [Sedimentibacter sp. B4]|uniref:Na+/H+ antiporter NhaC n=1 Tax=Sedimentibacter sp. B4 TaxID=304766 RepID=UPI0002EC8903|nr:Na+/H+ antiporter NhaC [Sedimentibacter sp. B4]
MNEQKQPTFRFAFLVMILIVITLMGGLIFLKVDPHVLLITDIIIASFAAIRMGYKWDYVVECMANGVNKAMQTLFFFFLIGMAIGAWILSGTVPALISYGFNILNPTFFLPTSLIICSITALATGSSWSTAGTVGIALMGIGAGLGIPAPITAGMIVSGSYFGDKMSPLSDTTNLAPAIAGTNIYSHISAMLYTTVPSYVIALIIYTVLGLKYSVATLDYQNINFIQNAIEGMFNINIIVFIPLIVVLAASLLKFPAIPGMMSGIIVSIPISMLIQDASLADVINALNYGYASESGIEMVDALLTKGGIQSMMWTFSLAVIALALGGVLSGTGVFNSIVLKIMEYIKEPKYLPAATILTCIAVNLTMAEQYVSIVVTGELYKGAYEKAGLQPRMLSRCLEEGGTLTSSLIPWNTCGAVMFAALGVSATQYAPYAIINWLNPLLGMILPILGYSLLKKTDTKLINNDHESKQIL